MQNNTSNSPFSCYFREYLPATADIPADLQEAFSRLSVSDSRATLKESLKTHRKILLTPDDFPKEVQLLKGHMQSALLAEAILGTTGGEMRFQALQLINTIGRVDEKALSPVLVRVSSNDHLRNLSELTDVLSVQQISQPQMQQYFVGPLSESFRKAVECILAETFSVKWLDSFIELARSLNNLLKRREAVPVQTQKKLAELCREALKHTNVLRRDIITQLYLILLTLSSEEAEPEAVLSKVHYLHAKSVVYGVPVLSRFLEYTTVVETETKYHLLYGLSYSLEKEFPTYPNKAEVFDRIVQLFEVGRLAYNLLDQMVRFIIKHSGTWKLDGYTNRKFFFARCIIKALDDCQEVMAVWPSILSEGISHSGDLNTPFAIDCVQLILQLLFRRCQENVDMWLKLWIADYLKYLTEGNRLAVKGIIEYINPIVCKISKRPVLLRHLLELDQLNNHSQQNISLGIISLLQCYRENGLIEPRESGLYEYKEEPQINVPQSKLEPLLHSNNPSIALKAFEFVTVSQKPSDPVLPFEYHLCLQFYSYALITSNTDYRRTYLTVTRRFFERLRTVYERQLLPQVNKKAKPARYLSEFKSFMRDLVASCFQRLYPEMPFERANPSLEIIQSVFNFFGVYEYEIRKGTTLKPCQLLQELAVFTPENFSVLASCLQSSFENIRSLAYANIRLFPLDFKLDCSSLWEECLQLTNSLVIRQFESGCRLLCFLFERYRDQTPVPAINHPLKELALYEYLLGLMTHRYEVFSRDFTSQTPSYYKNLVHGLCMCFAFLFQQLAKDVKLAPEHYNPHAAAVQDLISRLFGLMERIISFAVEVSCANVSTVVLDSSQPKAAVSGGLKVDCRGHFIQEDKKQCLTNIETMLSGNTLMTSVEEEEGSIENTLVVSFYLLTRESGLLFQSVATLAELDNSTQYLSEKALTNVIYSFFYALVNLKHMGSVDRIARGLQRMSKALYRQQNQALSTLPENLLKRLLELLEQSKFTNILRRSAGIPYAFTCLLKSEALRRRHLVESTLNKLFFFAKNDVQESKQLRIHSLNILKRLFQDSDLRFQLDPFVSEAFVLSIRGFGTEDWGVRNSSLMLFSSLSLRTLGPKPELNLMQFFQKCPSLVDYFMEELNNYIKVKSMYPPLYPIALLLSRLTPFDNVESAVRDTHQKNSKLLRREQLNKFIPLLVQAGNTPNYMGRVIIGKALLPFLQRNNIIQFCTQLLRETTVKGGMNKLHNELLIVYHLLSSLHELEQKQNRDEQFIPQLNQKHIAFFEELLRKIEWLSQLNCPLVQEVVVKIAHTYLERWSELLEQGHPALYHKFVEKFQAFSSRYLKSNIFELKNFRFPQDLGHSVFRIEVIRLALAISNRLTLTNKSLCLFEQLLQFVAEQSAAVANYWRLIDSQVVTTYLQELRELLRDKTVKQDYTKIAGQLTLIAFQNPGIESGVLSRVLLILKRLRTALTQQQIAWLLQKSVTTHQPLKVAIFKILTKQKNCDINLMTAEFSKPDQLTVFREAAVKSIRSFEEKLIPTYLRLLQDEDSEVRKFTADQLSKVLGLPQLNETKMAQLILQRMPREQIGLVLSDGDLDTKLRNNEQTRIFSFDKPNKFRSDVATIVSLLLSKLPTEEVRQGFLLKAEAEDFVRTYRQRVFFRNEYKFEWVLRHLAHLILVEKNVEKARQEVNGLEPMLQFMTAKLAASLESPN